MALPNPADPRLQTLIDVTSLPTASGQEWRVSQYIERWAATRKALKLERDRAGNIVIRFAKGKPSKSPLFITAHLDHPAFVVERIIAPGTLELSFRGGVMDVFFKDAPITLHPRSAPPIRGTLIGQADNRSPAGTHYLAEIDGDGASAAIGDVATWALPPARVDEQGILHTPACDDLAAVAAALCAMDGLLAKKESGAKIGDVRLIFTLAEEIGFIGAIAACKLKTMPKGSRVLALENSRAFPESPVGGGPIVRVGDRLSVFCPWLTAACATRAEELFGGPALPRASERAADIKKRPWQRKLMAGGACEASVFCDAGFEATCLCLPLGNYHNMPHLDQLQAGTYDAQKNGPARCAPEFIHTEDFIGLVDLLVALGEKPPEPGDSPVSKMAARLYAERSYVLGALTATRSAKAPSKPKARAPLPTKPKARNTGSRRK